MKHLNTKTQFKEALSYLKESKNYIYAVLWIFFASIIFGLAFRDSLTFLDKILNNLISQTLGLNTPEITFFILQNNLQSALLSIVFGIFFGILPLFSAISNGVVLGYVLGRSYEIAGILSFWRLLPHGIFELPAIFISFGLGIKLGVIPLRFFARFALRTNKSSPYNNTEKLKKEFKRRFYQSFNTLLMIIIPLLIIAAIIEGLLISLIA